MRTPTVKLRGRLRGGDPSGLPERLRWRDGMMGGQVRRERADGGGFVEAAGAAEMRFSRRVQYDCAGAAGGGCVFRHLRAHRLNGDYDGRSPVAAPVAASRASAFSRGAPDGAAHAAPARRISYTIAPSARGLPSTWNGPTIADFTPSCFSVSVTSSWTRRYSLAPGARCSRRSRSATSVGLSR